MLKKLFGRINPDEMTKDITKLKNYFNIIYKNRKELGVMEIRIGPNILINQELKGVIGKGESVSVAGMNGNNDGLAQKLGAASQFFGEHNYYQFMLEKKYIKREMKFISEKLCSVIENEYKDIAILIEEKLPGFYVYLI